VVVLLLLHPADLLFDFGLFAALLSGAALRGVASEDIS
jgi:hypothetical protein